MARGGSGGGGGGTTGSTAGSCSGHGVTRSMSKERRPVRSKGQGRRVTIGIRRKSRM